MATVRTLNQILDQFREVANQHRQINNFTVGTADDWATSGTTNYPAWWVTYEDADFEERKELFNFTFIVVDRVKKDRSNLQEIHSDTKLICRDIITQLRDPYYQWSTTYNTNLQAIYEPFHEDEVAGWSFTFTIGQPFTNDKCAIPFRETPTISYPADSTTGSTSYSWVPSTRTITINGVTYDLSANRSWTISTSGGAGTWGSITGTLSNQTDLQNALNAKEASITAGTTAQYWRGDKSWQTLDTSVVPENTNLYFTNARFDSRFSTKSTTDLTEGTNLYFTNARADARVTAVGDLRYWNLSGNALTGTEFIGSTNNIDLPIKTNNTLRGTIHKTGVWFVGTGTTQTAYNELLNIDGNVLINTANKGYHWKDSNAGTPYWSNILNDSTLSLTQYGNGVIEAVYGSGSTSGISQGRYITGVLRVGGNSSDWSALDQYTKVWTKGLGTGTDKGFKHVASDGSSVFYTQDNGLGYIKDSFTINGQTASTLTQLDANKKLVSIANGTGALTNNGSGAFSWVSYLTGNQSITLSGDISGSGSTSITTTIGSGKVTNAMLAGSIDYSKLASMTSANLASIVSDETGSGALVFGTSPTFTTNLTTPQIVLSGNISQSAWTTSGVGIRHSARTITDTSSSGTVATAYTNFLGGNTIAASNATTFTDYYSTYINSPVAGSNVTFTRTWSLGLQGNLDVGGNIKIGGVTSTGATGTGKFVFDTAPTLSNPIVGTQTANDNSTKAASTAYVDTANALNLKIANNLSDLNSAITARSNLGAPFWLSLSSAAFSPADATTYYWSAGFNAPNTTEANNPMKTGFAFKIVSATFVVAGNTTVGSTETGTIKFRNTTTTTSTTINSSVTTDASTTVTRVFSTTGLNISVGASDTFCAEFASPTWATNPIGTRWYLYLECIKA